MLTFGAIFITIFILLLLIIGLISSHERDASDFVVPFGIGILLVIFIGILNVVDINSKEREIMSKEKPIETIVINQKVINGDTVQNDTSYIYKFKIN